MSPARAPCYSFPMLTRRQTTERARTLRGKSGDAERRLWAHLRNRQLIDAKFRRQVPIDRYFADFASREVRLVIELDGVQHADQVEYDEARTAVIEAAGWLVLRFWSTEVMNGLDGVLTTIAYEIMLARARPLPGSYD